MTPRTLNVAAELHLPIDAVTETFGILAKKGAGKSNAAVVLAEEMWKVGVPWVAIDPKGDWWGLRSSSDGTKPGLPLVVFGGRHGDIPLEPTAGAMLADLILDNRLTCILDVSEFSKGDVTRFLLAFADRLYRQAESDPLHLFLEEAHEYLPQRVMHDEARLVGAWGKIVKQGRFKGIGCTLVSQRSASLNKDVLTQVDTLIVLRTTSPQDRAAVKAWVDVHDASAEMMAELPSLANGEAWVWSPEFLGTLAKVQFRRRETFDSGATPKVGEARRPPATLADVDLAAIKEAMTDTIDKVKADDPKELRKRIAELERQLSSQRPVETIVEVERIVEVIPGSIRGPLARLEALNDIAERVRSVIQDVAELRTLVDATPTPTTTTTRAEPPRPQTPAARSAPARDISPNPIPTNVTIGGGAERRILTVLATHGPRTPSQLAMQAGISPRSSTLSVALSKLRKLGYVEPGQPITITQAGVDELGEYTPLPAGAALLAFWQNWLGSSNAERRVFDVLAESYPGDLTAEDLADRAEISLQSSTMSVALSKLRKLGLVEARARRVTDEFMEAIA